MKTKLRLRLADGTDAAGIAALSRDRIENGLGWRWNEPRVSRSMADRATNVIVATDGSQLLGFGIMKYHDDEAHLLLLAVRAEVARGGIGSAIVAWLERSALVAGLGQVYLDSRLDNAAARAFYARLGYLEVQTVPGYYQGREACIRLAKDLWLAPVAPG